MKFEEYAARIAPYALSVLRIVAALLFMEHGLSKIVGFPPIGHLPAMFEVHWFAGVIECVGGALVLVGLCTRPAAFVMSGEMAFAYFMSHATRGFLPMLNGGDAAILFCFVFLYIAVSGAGGLSLDAVRQGRRSGKRAAPAALATIAG